MDSPGTAMLLHGSGSTGEFAERALGPALRAEGWEVRALEDRSGDVETLERAIGRAAAHGDGPLLLAGISLGAHAAVRWAAHGPEPTRLVGLLLGLPAWTGAPADVAALSALAADDVERDGMDQVLARLRDQGWVGAELARAWPGYGQERLVRALRATAAAPGPTPEQLAAVPVPVGLVAVADDPFHPVRVAQEWQRLLPRAALEVLPASAPAADRSVIGGRGMRALRQACASGSR
ncbi:MAG: alpha/beta fold hydrolase [Motilibacteraceae bacterium]